MVSLHNCHYVWFVVVRGLRVSDFDALMRVFACDAPIRVFAFDALMRVFTFGIF